MPNFLSLFTWNFCLPFKYCLKASNYTVCFILRYLILQYRYNRYPIPMSAIFYQKLIIIGVVVLLPKITWQKKYKIRPPTMVKTLTLVFNFVVEGGGGICPMVWAQSSLTGQNSPRKVGSMRMLQFPHTGVFLSKRSLS